MKKKYNIKWWSNYIDGDILKRSKMISKLPFVKTIIPLCNSDMILKYKKHTIELMLQSFFDDCIDEMELRNDKNENNNH